MSFLNKVVFITGGASGIGKTTALYFAKQSARLAIVDLNEVELKIAAEQYEKLSRAKVLKIKADLTNDEDVKRAVDTTFKQYGRIDVVVNSAGIFASGSIFDANLMDKYDKVIAINLRSIAAVTHYAAPALIESKGSIINISSAAAVVTMSTIPYTVSKASLSHFTRCVAMELAPKGVRVNAIQPSEVKTNLILNSGASRETNDILFKNAEKISPLKRLVKAEELAELIVFLASDKAKSITGVCYTVDAGTTLQGGQGHDQAFQHLVKEITK